MIQLKKTLLTLVALFAMTADAWADPQEELLTTVTATGETTYSQSPEGVVTVTLSDINNYNDNAGWNYSGTVTVEAVEGYTITRCEFKKQQITPLVDDLAPFSATIKGGTQVSVTAKTGELSSSSMDGITTILVYGYKSAPTGPEVTKTEGKTNEWTFTMPAGNVELQVEYYPAMLTLAASPADGGKVELDAAAAPVEWTPETWTNVSTTGQHGDLTSGDITLTATGGWLTKQEDGNLSLYSADNEYDHHTLTFSTTGDGFTRIELTMTSDASNHNPHITPADGWTFSGKSAVWEGEATKSLVCQNCTTTVSKITFYRGSGLPTGVEKDETGNIYVKSGTTVKLKATPEEGYEFASWADDASITTAEREITMGDADLTVTANFTAKPYDVTLAAKNAFTIEAGMATVSIDGTAATPEEGKISGVTKGQRVAITAATGYKFRTATAKNTVKLLSITVGAVTVYYAEGDSWADAIKRDENKDSGLFIREGNRVHHPDYGQLVDSNTTAVLPDAIINANESYKFVN